MKALNPEISQYVNDEKILYTTAILDFTTKNTLPALKTFGKLLESKDCGKVSHFLFRENYFNIESERRATAAEIKHENELCAQEEADAAAEHLKFIKDEAKKLGLM